MTNTSCSTATFAVIDVETTGLDPNTDRVVEVACLRIEGGVVVERFSTLIDPQCPIAPAASAIHGICDRDVAGAPRIGDVVRSLQRMARGAVVVGHNVRFDLAFLPCLQSRPSLCTLQLARRTIDAPNYRNETLRDVLGLSSRVDAADHRAGSDAAVTAAILMELLQRHETKARGATVQSVLDMVSRPVQLQRFTFGRYRNATIRSVPTGYLRWIVAEGFHNWPDVRHTAMLELTQRGVAA